MHRLNTLFLSILLILAGDLLAWGVQTNRGRIQLQDIRWLGSDGTGMSGLLYVPPGATPDNPAPGVLAVHGYMNSRETQDGFAIELARRGFVVLAMDQTGHGYSDPPAFRNGFGGPDGLAYLRSLDFVDRDNIGLEGHSMGGWAVLLAAAAFPDGYRSVVLEGSSTGTSGAPDATDGFPRNLAVVFSRYDEFSGLMWGVPVAADAPSGEKLKTAFGTDEPVEVGRIYGSVADGTARVFFQPPIIHPGDHFSRRAIGHALDWFQSTLDGESAPRPPGDQIWIWKALGNFIALMGMVLLVMASGGVLLRTKPFQDLAGTRPAPRGAEGWAWFGSALVFAAFPAVTLFPFKTLGGAVPLSRFFPQSITNQIVVWALLVALVSGALFTLWHFTSGRKGVDALAHYGVIWEDGFSWRKVGKSFLLASLAASAAYLTLWASGVLLTVDYRIWVFAIKPMSPLQARIGLSYLIPFVLFFLVYGLVLFGQLRRQSTLFREGALFVALSTLGFVALIGYQYLPLFLGGTLAIPSEPLWSIIAFQFLPIMTIVALVTAYFQRATGHVYVGAFLSGILVTWIVVASQPIHFGF